MVDIKEEVKLNGENKDCDAQEGRGPPIHMDCYKGIKKALQGLNSDSSSDSGSDEEDRDGGNDIDQVN